MTHQWLKEGEIKTGDTVCLDSGFTCIGPGPALIREDSRGLYFACREGNHYIDGQLDEGTEYIGIYAPDSRFLHS